MATVKISSDVNRILFVKNLNYKTTGEDIYDLFGK
jgi:pre-mRNA branch site protein p14